MPEKIYIMTGPVRSGKTTLLSKWSAEKKDVFGILTPVVRGKRFFYDAHTKEKFEMEAEPGEKNIFVIGRFVFSKNSFVKAIEILKKAIQNDKDWVVVDEIGPLELKGKGFSTILKTLLKTKESFKLLIVVRETLAEKVIDHFKIDKNKLVIVKADPAIFESLS